MYLPKEIVDLIKELADDLEAELKDRWGDPRLQRQLTRDLDVVERAREIIKNVPT